MELHIGKVVVEDRGNYRLEVKAKDFCDSCAFNIDVEGALVGVAGVREQRVVGGGARMGVSAWCRERPDVGVRFGEEGENAGVGAFKTGEILYGLRP